MNGRVTIFSLAAVPVYIAGYYLNRPLFFFYPKLGRIAFTPDADGGPAIMWYGWLASALLLGAVAAFVIPARWSRRVPFDLSWMMFLAAFLAVLIYEKRWFF